MIGSGSGIWTGGLGKAIKTVPKTGASGLGHAIRSTVDQKSDGLDKSAENIDSDGSKGWHIISDSTREAALHIPSPGDPASSWIEWHKTISGVMGKAKANDIWLYSWNKRKGSSGFGFSGSDANTVELRKYMESKGIKIEKDGLLEYSADGLDSIEGSFKKFFGIGSTITIVVVIVILMIVCYALYNIAKNPGAAAGTAVKYAV